MKPINNKNGRIGNFKSSTRSDRTTAPMIKQEPDHVMENVINNILVDTYQPELDDKVVLNVVEVEPIEQVEQVELEEDSKNNKFKKRNKG